MTGNKKQKNHLFQPGQSGNPTGRPPGSRNQSTLAAMALLESQVEALTQKAVEMALGGDLQALKLCLERLVAPVKERPLVFELPRVTKTADRPAQLQGLIDAVTSGELPPADAEKLLELIEAHKMATTEAIREARYNSANRL